MSRFPTKKKNMLKIAAVSRSKISKETRRGIRVYTDLREAVSSMTEHNSLFYYNPRIDDLSPLSEADKKKITRLDCKCNDNRKFRAKFLETLEIRYCCRHLAGKIAELDIHPLTYRILEHKAKLNIRERFAVLSTEQPIILGFPSTHKLQWVNVYHYNRKREVAIRFSYHLFEKKWSFGRVPPEGSAVVVMIEDVLAATLFRHQV